MSKKTTLITVLCIVFVLISLFFIATPIGRETWNTWFYAVQKADDLTSYRTKKQVEDDCRAMMASYTSDKLTYTQYADHEDTEKQSWGEQAKMRANKTAASYNEYILKNSYVWDGNIPQDLLQWLPYLE